MSTVIRNPERLIRRLRQVGVKGALQKMRMTASRMSRSSYASLAISNGYLAELGLYALAELETGVLLSYLSTAKLEPYPNPYGRFYEKAEPAVAPLAQSTRLCFR